MSNIIKLKRGSGSDPSASDLVVGEVALRTDSGKLFTKKDNGNVAEIGGSGISDGDKGDITVSNSGDTFTIDNGVISSSKLAASCVTTVNLDSGAVTNDKVNANAAIAGTKINPNFGSQNVSMGEKLTLSATTPNIEFTDTNHNPDYRIKTDNGAFTIEDAADNSDKFVINSDGHIDIAGNLDVGAGIDVTGDITSTGELTLQSGNLEQIHRSWTDTSDSDIYGLLSGSTFGTIVEGANNGHHVVALRDNDSNDSFAIISGGGNYQTNDTFDKLVARFRANGNTVLGGDLQLSGNITIENSAPEIFLKDSNNNDDFTIRNNNGVFTVRDATNGVDRFTIESDGHANFTNRIDALGGIAVTNNISVSGTVDGRDVAADGTKLDGIESNATADQTASEILTLLKTVDGVGSGLDADLLDGVSHASFLRSDANDTFTGTLTAGQNGKIAFPDNTTIPDNPNNEQHDYITFGANGSISQISGRVGLMITSSDDALVLANGDIGRNFTASNINVDIEDIFLLSDNNFVVKTDLQEGWGTEHTLDFTAAGLLRVNANTVWHAGNDGSGSGLDADSVDGIAGSSFLRSDANDTATGDIEFTGHVRIVTGDITNTNTTKGLMFDGNYETGQYRTRLRKDDKGGGIPLYIDSSEGTANSYTAIARFGSYSGNAEKFEVFGTAKATTFSGSGASLTNIPAGQLTGTVVAARLDTATTQSAGNNTTKIATTAFVSTAISNLINNAPSALDTLKELSDALGADANFSTTVTNSIATKLPLAGGTLTGNLTIQRSSGTSTLVVTSTDDYATLEIGGSTGAFIDLKSPASDDYDIRFVHSGHIYAKTNITLSPTSGNVVNVDRNLNALEGLDVTGGITASSTGNASLILDAGTGSQAGNQVSFIDFKLDGTVKANIAVNEATSGNPLEINSAGTGATKLFNAGSEKLSTSSSGVSVTGTCTATTFSGSGASLTNVNATTLDSIDSGSFLRSDADDTMSANLTVDNGTSTLLNVKCDNAGNAIVRAGGDSQGTGAFEVSQNNGTHGGGIAYNGDGTPSFASGETADHITFYRIDSGTRTEVFHYPYNSNVVNFNDRPTVNGVGLVKSDDTIAQATNASTLDSINSTQFLRSDANDTSSGTIAFGRGTLDPDSFGSFSGGFGGINDGSGWAAQGVFVHGGGTGDAAAIAHNGSKLYFGIQNGSSANSMATWLDVTPSTRVINFQTANNATNVQIGGNKIFHAGNDGSGSGLDADTLDGSHATSFINTTSGTQKKQGTLRIGNSSNDLAISFDGTATSNSVGHTASNNEGIFWHTNLTSYGIYRTSGAWTSPNYQQLRLDWPTGIILDGGDQYGKSGVRMESDFLPVTDSTYDIGTSANRFANGYFDTLYGSGANLTALNASNISSGTLPAARLPNHSASLLTSGTIPAARVPTLNQNTTGNAATASDAALLDGLDSSQFLRSDASDVMTGNFTLDGNFTMSSGHVIVHNETASRDKIRLWSSSQYAIGMDNAMSFGGLNDYAITFSMNNDNDRGWIFLDTSHTDAQGAMSLTTNGKLAVAHSVRLGYGESDTTTPGATYRLDVNGATRILGDAAIGDGSANTRILIKKADNNTSDHIQFYNGTTRIGEIGCHDGTWLRINQVTAKNIYTPRYIRSDGGFFVDGTSKGINGSGNFIGGTIAGASDYSSLLRSNADDIATHRIQFQNNATDNHDTIATGSGSQGGIEIYNTGGGNDAFMAFHAGGDFACYFGLDADINDIAVGGWSMGANKYRIWHQNNDGSGSGLDSDTVDGIQGSSFLRSDTADTASGDITFSGGAGAATIAANSDIRFTNGNWTGNAYGKIQQHSNYLYIAGGTSGIIFREDGTDRWFIDGSGHFRPAQNNTYDIGTSSHRVRNIYVNDAHFSNEGSSNSIDGSWGDWTLQEGEEDIFMINNRTGKKFKIAMIPV